ncbi:hypothetical protein [Aquimarina aquimarini]|uniref:hypothetical protein n=1 Tax=Aquimarina aquimarini TaxID=1191734 RepID=UPI000D556C1E|nr:hypothetical protein [Aquimarina aquimarini]
MNKKRTFLNELYTDKTEQLPFIEYFQKDKSLRVELFNGYLKTELKPNFNLFIISHYNIKELEKGFSEAFKNIPLKKHNNVAADFVQMTEFESEIKNLRTTFNNLCIRNELAKKYYSHSINETEIISRLNFISLKINDFKNLAINRSHNNFNEYATNFAKDLIQKLEEIKLPLLQFQILKDFVEDQENIDLEIDFIVGTTSAYSEKEINSSYRELKMYADNYINDFLHASPQMKEQLIKNKIAYELIGNNITNTKSIRTHHIKDVLNKNSISQTEAQQILFDAKVFFSTKQIQNIIKPINTYLKQSNDISDPHYYLEGFEPSEIRKTDLFSIHNNQIKTNGFIKINIDGNKAKIYTPELAIIFSNDYIRAKIRNSNLIRNIDTYKFMEEYTKAFIKGKEYFKKEFSPTLEILYGTNNATYIKTLHHNYFHSNFDSFKKGWSYVKDKYPIIINNKIIRKYGYYSGIVSEVDELINKHPELFKNFGKCSAKKDDNIIITRLSSVLQPKTNIKSEINNLPVFDSDKIDTILSILNVHFDDQKSELKLILENKHQPKTKLNFTSNANKLADFFKQLFEAKLISNCTKKELEQWIFMSFTFKHRSKQIDFKLKTLEDIISNKSAKPPCKSPLIRIENGNIIKV